MVNKAMDAMGQRHVKIFRVFWDSLLILMMILPVILFRSFGIPYRRGFYCDDESLRYPFRDSTVTSAVLYCTGIFVPIIFIVVIEAFRLFHRESRMIGYHVRNAAYFIIGRPIPPYFCRLYTFIGYFLFGAAMSQTLTDIGKYLIGRLRPHFIVGCNPANLTTVLCPAGVSGFKYIEDFVCTNLDLNVVREVRLSFPSGHSSFAFYTATFLIIYLHTRLNWNIVSVLLRPALQLSAGALAFGCALSRISDYKHHWSDVLAGSTIGLVIGCLTVLHCPSVYKALHIGKLHLDNLFLFHLEADDSASSLNSSDHSASKSMAMLQHSNSKTPITTTTMSDRIEINGTQSPSRTNANNNNTASPFGAANGCSTDL